MTALESHAGFVLQNPQDPRAPQQLQGVSAIATRGCVFARQLLAVGGRHAMQLEPLDLNEAVENLERTLQHIIGTETALQTRFGKFVSPIMGDKALIEHILVTLAMNAHDAMPAGGALTITTAGVRIDKVAGKEEHPAGEFVRLSVRDTGCGIPTEMQPRIFELFFTTKKGAVGLGLASVHGAAQQMSGWVEFTSEPGAGTEFRIFLPCAPASARLAQPAVQATRTKKVGTVLLVQGDDRARGLARYALDWNGYRVIEADSGSLALMLWGGQSAGIDLLITDSQLPGDISGMDLARQVQQAKPGLPVVFTSQSGPDQHCQPLPNGSTDFISRPYSPEKLLETVRAALAKR
jgi:CheY-like chemotaxis protein